MKHLRWFTIAAELLLLGGITALGTVWQGSGSVTGAFPFHASSVSLNGSASGGWAMFGLASSAAGLVLLTVSLLWALFETLQERR